MLNQKRKNFESYSMKRKKNFEESESEEIF